MNPNATRQPYGKGQSYGGAQAGGRRGNKAPYDKPPVPAPEAVDFKLKENGKVSDKLFDEKAKEIAKSFARADNEKGQVSATQIRRLFDEVKRYERIINSPEKWAEQKPYIKMMKSKVAYTMVRAIERNKGAKDYYKNLEHFIFCGIDQIDVLDDYRIFVSLFEAVYGYYYGMSPAK